MLLGEATVAYSSAAHDVQHSERVVRVADAGDNPQWSTGDDLQAPPRRAGSPAPGATFDAVPAGLTKESAWRAAETEFRRWASNERPLRLWSSRTPKLVSRPGETEDAFRGRLAHAVREERDAKKETIRERYAERMKRIEDQVERADRAVAREEGQVRSRGFDTIVSVGSGILGAFMGRRITQTTIRGVGRAARSAGRVQAEREDVAAAERRRAELQARYADLDAELTRELDELDLAPTPAPEPVEVRARQNDVGVETVTLAWVPHLVMEDGRRVRAV
jgi:hypothetical protein